MEEDRRQIFEYAFLSLNGQFIKDFLDDRFAGCFPGLDRDGHAVAQRVPPKSTVPDSKRLAHSYELLGRDAGRVFPVRFESDVKLVGGPAKDSVPGFLVLEDFQTRKTKTVV